LATFYAAVLVFWMLPVQLGARVMLNAAKHRIPGTIRAGTGFSTHICLGCSDSFAWWPSTSANWAPSSSCRSRRTRRITKLTILAADQVEILQRITIGLGVAWLLIWAVLNPWSSDWGSIWAGSTIA
jgi:hypothetical protein